LYSESYKCLKRIRKSPYMVNQSQVKESRFLKKWQKSGAEGNIEDAKNIRLHGRETANKLRRYDCRGQGLEGIDKALQEGYILRAFRSGGGLRVVRIETEFGKGEGELKGYGEHLNLMPALRRASNDFLAGGKPYKAMYLTGTSQAEDSLDNWVLSGQRFIAQKDENGIKVLASDFNYRPIISAVGETFEKAYTSLCEKVTEKAYERANGF
jgi:hypothetical protein